MSDAVEERLETLLEHTDVDPYGNPIPGIEGVTSSAVQSDLHSVKDRVARGDLGEAVIVRIAEGVQTDPDFLGRLSAAGVVPGARVRIEDDGGRVTIAASGGGERPGEEESNKGAQPGREVKLSDWQQAHLFAR